MFAVYLLRSVHGCVCAMAMGVCALKFRCVDTLRPSVSVTIGCNAFKRPQIDGIDVRAALLPLL